MAKGVSVGAVLVPVWLCRETGCSTAPGVETTLASSVCTAAKAAVYGIHITRHSPFVIRMRSQAAALACRNVFVEPRMPWAYACAQHVHGWAEYVSEHGEGERGARHMVHSLLRADDRPAVRLTDAALQCTMGVDVKRQSLLTIHVKHSAKSSLHVRIVCTCSACGSAHAQSLQRPCTRRSAATHAPYLRVTLLLLSCTMRRRTSAQCLAALTALTLNSCCLVSALTEGLAEQLDKVRPAPAPPSQHVDARESSTARLPCAGLCSTASEHLQHLLRPPSRHHLSEGDPGQPDRGGPSIVSSSKRHGPVLQRAPSAAFS